MQLASKIPMKSLASSVHSGRWDRYRSPQGLYPVIGRMLPWLAGSALLFCGLAIAVGFTAPLNEFPQGTAFKIVFLHAPAEWMARFVYLLMAAWAMVALLHGGRLPSMMVRALAPTGAIFALMALWSGSLWGRVAWGTWWDARLTAELTLALLYVGAISVHVATEKSSLSDWVVAVPASGVVGILVLSLVKPGPWYILHLKTLQGAIEGAPVSGATLVGIAGMFLGFWLYASAMALLRLRCIILEGERDSEWVAPFLETGR